MKQPILRKTIITVAACFLLAAAIPLLLFSGTGGHFFLNSFFVNIGFTGDSIFAVALVFFLMFFLERKDLSLRLLLGLMVSLALVQLCKNMFSPHPGHLYFEDGIPEAGSLKNIISSHTAVVFTLAAFFSMHTKNILIRVLIFATAATASLSRLYFGTDSFASLAFGLLPAAGATFMMYNSDFGAKAKKVFKKRRNTRISTQHLMPA